MELNGERVTLEKLAAWSQKAHQDNVTGLAIAMVAGYDVREDDSLSPNGMAFVGHPGLIAEAKKLAEKIKTETQR